MRRRTGLWLRGVAATLGAVALLGAAPSVGIIGAAGDEPLEPTAPAGLRCSGRINPASPPSPAAEWQLRWEWQWQILSADPVFQKYAPMGIALDAGCNVYVGGYSPVGGRIVKLSPAGDKLAEWGADGHGVGQFERMEGLALDGAGNMYAADSANSRVQKFAPTGDVVMIWASRFDCPKVTVKCQVISDDSTFNGNITVAVDGTGSLYVGDGYHGVKKFSAAGPLVTKWGPPNIEFAINNVTLDRQGNVYMADTAHRVQKVSPTGAVLAQWAVETALGGQLLTTGVAVDGEGTVYVSDADHHRIVKLSPSSSILEQWGRCSSMTEAGCERTGMGTQPGEFAMPAAMVADARGELFVADRFNYRVQVRTAVPTWIRIEPPVTPAYRVTEPPAAEPMTPPIPVIEPMLTPAPDPEPELSEGP